MSKQFDDFKKFTLINETPSAPTSYETNIDLNKIVCMFEPRTDTTSATICKHCDQEKFLHNQVLDVEKLAKLVKEMNKQPMTFVPDETLYTEEQVREAIKKALHIWNWRAGKVNVKSICEEVIQSLKQPKQ